LEGETVNDSGAQTLPSEAVVGDNAREISDDLGFASAMAAVRDEIVRWLETCDGEIRPHLRWQFGGGSKYFRPLTVFSCHRATTAEEIGPPIIRSAFLVELIHNVSLVIDDIVDRSPQRRGKPTLHTQFGELPALMVSGYIVADAFRLIGQDRQATELIAELMKRLAVAECLQWRLRRTPLGIEDWRRIASEDTGSMFEVAACLGDRSEALRHFGGLLGLLYHGCDDVADVRGATGLGGGGSDDLRDGILTLPAALAIRDPAVARLFCNPQEAELPVLAAAFQAKLPEAEGYLDRIAEEAWTEARLFARNPAPLQRLVEQTRLLSRR
jgi:geranylgeranyl pyrophosphate synthase